MDDKKETGHFEGGEGGGWSLGRVLASKELEVFDTIVIRDSYVRFVFEMVI